MICMITVALKKSLKIVLEPEVYIVVIPAISHKQHLALYSERFPESGM